MSQLTQQIGQAEARWEEREPLAWSMTRTRGTGKHVEEKTISINLACLQGNYSTGFLLALKAHLLELAMRVAIPSVKQTADRLRHLLNMVARAYAEVLADQPGRAPIVERIDSGFLRILNAPNTGVPHGYLPALMACFKTERANPALFEPGLVPADFPRGRPRKGHQGQLRDNVLHATLSRSTLVQIMNITEAAYASGELDLARYAFSRLMLSRAARPETYRSLRCKDLRVDGRGADKTYYLELEIPKARTAARPRATVRMHPEVGRILEVQREAVVRKLAHLVDAKNAEQTEHIYTAGDLALFPMSPRIDAQEEGRLGGFRSSASFQGMYVLPLQKLTTKRLTSVAIRHSIGTQLAAAGCAATTIAAVLLHATDATARVYVDLHFEGAIDSLSQSLEPAFEKHFPIFKDPVPLSDVDPSKRVISKSSDITKKAVSGQCGALEVCEYRPLACYECPRFIPAYDADHGINLGVVEERIRHAEAGGLPRRVDVARFRHIANAIRVVINICEAKREAIEAERDRRSAA